MQFKSILIALGFAAAANAAAIPSQLEARASPPFYIRRFTPLAGFNEAAPVEGTWSNNQYTKIMPLGNLYYTGIGQDDAFKWTFEDGVLRGSASGVGGLVPRAQQSYEITVTPVVFGGFGDPCKVTIGPPPLYEVKFQTVRNDAPVSGYTALSQIGGAVYLGKAADISAPIRFRAIGYTPPI